MQEEYADISSSRANLQIFSFRRYNKNLKFFGLKGVEVYHPSHSKEQTNNFYNLSKNKTINNWRQ